MQKKDCFLIGRVFKLHGYKGDVNIYNNNDINFNFKSIRYLFLEENKTLIPFSITKIKSTKSNVILTKFEDINTEEDALKILKKEVYIPITFLPKSEKNKLSDKKILGFKVEDYNLGEIGKVISINTQTPQKLIFVNNNGKEFCFPMHKEFVLEIDHYRQIIKVNIPEDLINLN
tara:strand:- start:115 stop:636 length:522 start_codon:yes stop_codon:yes gene_type:complete